MVYNGHLRGPVTLTPVAERLAVEMSLSVFTSWACGGWDSNTQPSTCDANALTDCANAAASKNVYMSAASCIQCMVSVLCPIKDGRSDARLRVQIIGVFGCWLSCKSLQLTWLAQYLKNDVVISVN